MLQLGEGQECATQLSANDVYDVFQLPRNEGNDVIETPRHRPAGDPNRIIVDRWRSRFEVPDKQQSAFLHQLANAIKATNEANDDFKRDFVAYALGVLLAQTPNKMIDVKVLKAVEDIDNINTLDWCKYLLEHLGKCVYRWKKNITDESVGGCVLFLQIVYLHRSKFQGVTPLYSLPLIRHWNDDIVKQRLNNEKLAGFGTSLLDLESFPICRRIFHGKETAAAFDLVQRTCTTGFDFSEVITKVSNFSFF
ncbi:Molybdopterin synthase catalytic subunit [Bienertia sinuspersici]